jgi:hypothetical protein
MPADSTRLPIAIIGTSARPAGRSGKMLHQLREQAEGVTPTFLLQCMSLFLARSRRSEKSVIPPLSGGKQTQRRHAKIDVNDRRRYTASLFNHLVGAQ